MSSTKDRLRHVDAILHILQSQKLAEKTRAETLLKQATSAEEGEVFDPRELDKAFPQLDTDNDEMVKLLLNSPLTYLDDLLGFQPENDGEELKKYSDAIARWVAESRKNWITIISSSSSTDVDMEIRSDTVSSSGMGADFSEVSALLSRVESSKVYRVIADIESSLRAQDDKILTIERKREAEETEITKLRCRMDTLEEHQDDAIQELDRLVHKCEWQASVHSIVEGVIRKEMEKHMATVKSQADAEGAAFYEDFWSQYKELLDKAVLPLVENLEDGIMI